MAQPLDCNIPAFCLACFGTNNKFTAEHVLLRWQRIYKECEKRKIHVISFGGDGDPRIMKAMLVSTGLLSNQFQIKLDGAVPLSYPSSWSSWFWMNEPSRIAYVQDVVHIAVKLKCRLLKPSIVLPMGSYVAGVHHLRKVKKMFQKDIHGLQERDIDYKDKQNFDAVLHIIRSLPDAAGTKQYINAMCY